MAQHDATIGALVAGKYRIKRLIGHGAMGRVYEAVHAGIGKRFAVKIIHPQFSEQSEECLRFRREAFAVNLVESEHIVQVFDVGRDAKHGLYMILELLVGEDMEQYLAREGTIGPHAAIAIGVQAARGLSKLHAAGVIHRDLKPANIFLARREDGTTCIKLLDFGISKLEESAITSSVPDGITAPGVMLGTPQYMAPEQAEGITPLDARSDLFSLAAVLYEALSGEPMYRGRTFLEIMVSAVRDQTPPLRTIAPWVPQVLARVIDAALAREREDRTSDALTFAKRLLVAAESCPAGDLRFSSMTVPVVSPASAVMPKADTLMIAPDDEEEPVSTGSVS
jgi:eukaryotic-like serine/threonine-protein kinase